MASLNEEEEECDRGSEASFKSLPRRRREVSDDDDEEDGETKRNWGVFCSGDESEGLGKAPEESEDDESCIDELEALGGREYEYLEEEAEGFEGREIEDLELGVADAVVRRRKEVEPPFVVPRDGLFFMHDDRYMRVWNRTPRRGRQPFGGSKLWVPKDNEKWQHDKFEEEMRFIDQKQGDSKNHGANNSLRFVKGRGPVKYKPLTWINNVIPSAKPEMSLKAQRRNPNINQARILSKAFGEIASTNSRSANIKSSLPKNYVLGSSNHDSTVTDHKWDSQPGRTYRHIIATGVLVDEFYLPKSNYIVHETSPAEHIGQAQYQKKDSIHLANWNNQLFQSSETSSTDMAGSYHSKFERKGLCPSISTVLPSTIDRGCLGLRRLQLKSQHSDGPVLPADHMAFPGYAAVSQLATRTSETTGPLLSAGTAYSILDGDYFYKSSGQISTYGIYGDEGCKNKPLDKNAFTNNPSQQGKNKIKRYSEITFGTSSY